MKFYKTKIKSFSGSDYHEVMSQALAVYRQMKRTTKRKPFIRSKYFKKDNVAKKQKYFLSVFPYNKKTFR